MFRVRHYGDLYHPDLFRGGGALGTLIRALNWMRWKLEVFVQYLVLRFLMHGGSLPFSSKKKILQTFRADVAAEEAEMLQTSPDIANPEPLAMPRGEKYREGNLRSTLDSFKADAEGKELPTRPVRMDDMIARNLSARASRYSKGHRHVVVDEDSFEPLAKDVL